MRDMQLTDFGTEKSSQHGDRANANCLHMSTTNYSFLPK